MLKMDKVVSHIKYIKINIFYLKPRTKQIITRPVHRQFWLQNLVSSLNRTFWFLGKNEI